MSNTPLPRSQEGSQPSELPQRPVHTEMVLMAPPEAVEQVEQESGPSMHPEAIPQVALPTIKARTLTTTSTVAEPEEAKMIESILSEGLEAEYQTMSPAVQARFRQEGERVAIAIQTLLHHSKKAARQILNLIRRWLGLIPGVNKFFLEQEAKIKTDQLLKINESSDID